MHRIAVNLGDRTYPILVGPGVRRHLTNYLSPADGTAQLVVIADQTVADLHLERLQQALPPGPLALSFPPGETSKSLATAARLYDQLATAAIERAATLIAFGGGVAGDLAGFVAATWLRGVAYVQVPTTLLAAVDASVGGKTAVNIDAGKNLVGAFHQPLAVIIDTEFLETLSQREFRAGLAESIKHAVIRDPDFLLWHEANVQPILARAADTLTALIARNCVIKADVVARDEREAGLRAILNYGHTVGHAIEHLLDYTLRHGECVGLGMLVENELACARGILARAEADRIRTLVERFGLPLRLPRALDADNIWAACTLDKKVRSGAVNFVLIRAIGQPQRVTDITPAELATALGVIQPR